MGVNEQYAAQMDSEFLGEAQDTLASLEITVGNLRSKTVDEDEGLSSMVAQTSGILQICASAEQPLIDLTLRRLNSYIDGVADLTTAHLDDIEAFLMVLRDILEGEIEPSTDEAEFFRSLPTLRPVDVSDLEHLNLEVLLIDRQKTTAKVFERELQNCGFRVQKSLRSFEAMELAVRTLPDMIISAVVLDDLSGVDLSLALGAIPSTSAIPFAVLTSFPRSHASLKDLPDNVALLHKGDAFGEDLASALEKFGLT